MDWHSMAKQDVLAQLKVSVEKGLSQAQAEKQLRNEGENKLAERRKKSILRKFLEQFSDFMVIILLIASGISFATAYIEKSGDYVDPIIILVIVILNAIIGVAQERKAERALEALKKLSAPAAAVIRGGKQKKVPSVEIVKGDIIYLTAGDLVPADARILESSGLKAQESALTGESLPSGKDADIILPPSSPPADRKNMLFSSTVIIAGHCIAVVTETGMNTQVGKIAHLLSTEEAPQTPLQIRLTKVGRILGLGAVAICAVIFLLGLLRKADILESFMLSVSLAVAAIPEGLPAIVTVVLSLGVQRMAKSNAIIRHLPAVETLGTATVICSDKTGTLTQNLMTVTDIYAPEGKAGLNSDIAKNILLLGSLCNNARLVGTKSNRGAQGDPTENAILIAADQAGLAVMGLNDKYPRLGENPFNSERKLMSTVNKADGAMRMVTKGAPDVLFSRCDRVLIFGTVLELSESRRQAVLKQNETMAGSALRVLGVAYKEIASLSDASEDKLIFCGLIGMLDPPRKEVFAAVHTCKEAGITPVMITGDHVITAKAIALKLGIMNENDISMTGQELDRLSQDELTAKIDRCRVFARVTPEHKVRIVKAYRARDEVVAMTGDGVNDAPALKAADIGCAMGRSGTQVAKGAADMVLTDDNFATIVKAVAEGRGIYDNIKKAVHFLLSCNIGEILAIFVASLLGMPTPLLPIQLLWVNLVTDSLPAMALGTERLEKDIMKRPPSPAKKSFFADGLGLDIALEGMLVGALTLLAFTVGRAFFNAADGVTLGRTMAFATLSLCEIVHSFNMRSSHSLFTIGIFTNKKLVMANIICTLMQVSVITVPYLSGIFKTVPLDIRQWLVVAALSLVPLVVMEIGKRIKNN